MEIAWALAVELGKVAFVIAFVSGLIGVCSLIPTAFMIADGTKPDDPGMALARNVRKVCTWLVVASAPFVVFPTPEQVFQVRLSLLKYHLASPENVQKGAEEIGRIAKKLECKYLGCEEKGDKK